jgi:hypothetical protein
MVRWSYLRNLRLSDASFTQVATGPVHRTIHRGNALSSYVQLVKRLSEGHEVGRVGGDISQAKYASAADRDCD